jgi:hypothetical protein
VQELYAALLSWAVTLSGHPAPVQAPDVVPVSHRYLVDGACAGRECKVLGWFPPGHTIYIDERLDPQENLLASSIVVHEMVHYLQQESRQGKPYDCTEALALEREAYHAQREFLLRYGVLQPVGISMHRVGCEQTAEHH